MNVGSTSASMTLRVATPGMPADFEVWLAARTIEIEQIEQIEQRERPVDAPARCQGVATILNVRCRVELLTNDDGSFVALCAQPLDAPAAWPFIASFPDLLGDSDAAEQPAAAVDAVDAGDALDVASGEGSMPGFFFHQAVLQQPMLLLTAANTVQRGSQLESLALWKDWAGEQGDVLSRHQGFSLFGKVDSVADPGGPLAHLRTLFGLDPSWSAGVARVSIDLSHPLPYLKLCQPIAGKASLGPLTFSDATLALEAPLYPCFDPARVLLSGAVALAGARLDLCVDVPAGPGDLVITGTLHARGTAPIEGASMGGLPGLEPDEALAVELRVGSSEPRLERLTVLVERKEWDLLGGVLDLKDASFRIVIDDPMGGKTVSGAAQAEVEIAGMSFAIGGFYPAGPISGALLPVDGKVLTLHQLAGRLGVDCKILPDCSIATLRVSYGLSGEGWQFSAAIAEKWSPTPDELLQLDGVRFSLRGPSPLCVDLDARLLLGDSVHLAVSASHHGLAGWTLNGSTGAGDRIEVGELIEALATRYGASLALPEALTSLAFVDLAVAYSQPDGRLSLAGSMALTVDQQALRVDLTTIVCQAGSGHKLTASGVLTIAGHRFEFSVDSEGKADDQQLALVASYLHDPAGASGAPDLHELVGALSPPLAEVVPHLTISGAAIACLATGEGATKSSRWLFGARFAGGLDAQLDLDGVPIVSSLLGDQLGLSISEMQILVSSAAFNKADMLLLGTIESITLPPTIGRGLISGQLVLGGVQHALSLPFGGEAAADPESAETAETAESAETAGTAETAESAESAEAAGTAAGRLPAAAATGDPAPVTGASAAAATAKGAGTAVATADVTAAATVGKSAEATTQWIPIARQLGPLFVEKAGVAYCDGKVSIALGLTVAASKLTLSLHGLRIATSLNAFKPSFDLAGLGLGYSAGAIEISGGLLKTGSGHETRYDGEALIKAETFTVSALGSYASTPQGAASLFIFGLLDKELGGPSFFHVTGLAAGFGYNRRLKLPALDDVAKFPLVTMATAEDEKTRYRDPAAALALLGSAIEVADGENWLAIGVRFTSYQVVKSFALLSVSFGTEVEIDLTGESTLTMPTELPEGQHPVAFARLAERVSFIPDRGVLTAAAKLCDDAFILSNDCHLSGGFALSNWFKKEHAGDFVVTLGGYHPRYAKPAHYPDVAPVGFTWQIGDLLIKGGMYFALTPCAVMAGGHLDAVWQSGGLRAWFLVDADFLMSWKPFHYDAKVSVSIGASFRVDLWVTSFTLTIHVDVALALWGPSFGGTAVVDLSVISFSIDFGAARLGEKVPISWSQFRTSFLPPVTPAAEQSVTLPDSCREMVKDKPATVSSAYCLARAAAGIERDLGSTWVVNGTDFELVSHSVIPATSATLYRHGVNPKTSLLTLMSDSVQKKIARVDVGPVNLPCSGLLSEHFVVVSRIDDKTRLPEPGFDFLAHVEVEPRWASVPSAIWSVAAAMGSGDGALDRISQQARDGESTIACALIGFRFKARLQPHESRPVDVKKLLTQPENCLARPFWSAPPGATGSEPRAGPHAEAGSYSDMLASMSGQRTVRQGVLAALARQIQLDADERSASLPVDLAQVMRHEPVFCGLGESL